MISYSKGHLSWQKFKILFLSLIALACTSIVWSYPINEPSLDSLKLALKKMQSIESKMETNRHIFFYYLRSRDFGSAQYYMDEISRLSGTLKEPPNSNILPFLKALILFQQRDMKVTDKSLKKAIQIYQREKDTTMWIYCKLIQAQVQNAVGLKDKAKSNFKTGLKLATQKQDSLLMAMGTNAKTILNVMGDNTQIVEEALRLMPTINQDSMTMFGMFVREYNLGMKMNLAAQILAAPERQEEGINILNEVIHQADRYKFSIIEVKSISNLLLAFAARKDFVSATKLGERALVLIRKNKLFFDEIFMLNNLSSMYTQDGVEDLAKALKMAQRALHLSDSLSQMDQVLSARISIANCRRLMNQECQELIPYVEEIVADARKYGYTLYEQTSLMLLAECNRELGHLNKAFLFYSKALDLMALDTQPQIILQTKRYLYEIAKELNRHKEALKFLEGYNYINDSLLTAENNILLGDIQVKYETAAMQDSIITQSRINNLLEKQSRSRGVLSIGAFVLAGLIAGLAFFFYHSRQRARRDQRQIQTLHNELDHRVKNNLNFLDSMIGIQVAGVEDSEIKMVLDATRNRIKTLALLHNMLDKKDGEESVQVEAYFPTLIAQLKRIADYSGLDVRINSHIQPIRLHPKEVFALALILNEWLTNAFKYAISKSPDPEIHIDLKKIGNDQVVFFMSDNGPGYDPQNIRKGAYGNRLVASQVKQLRGHLEVQTTGSTQHTLTFKTRMSL